MHPGPAGGVRAWGIRAVVLVLVAVYSGLTAALRPFTAPMEAAIGLPILGMAVVAASGRRTLRPRATEEAAPAMPVTWSVAWPWLVLFGALAGWELLAYLSSPRRDHPTLSSMVGVVLDSYPGRAALIAAWLSLGWALFLRLGPGAGPGVSPPSPPASGPSPPAVRPVTPLERPPLATPRKGPPESSARPTVPTTPLEPANPPYGDRP